MEIEGKILRLLAKGARRTAIEDDEQVLRPKSVHTDEEFVEFLLTKRCPVCLKVPRYPVAIVEVDCEHEGCETCLERLEICPMGRCKVYAPDKLLPFENWPHRAKVSFNQDLRVKCGDCTTFVEGTVEQLTKHELLACPNRTVRCTRKWCKVYGKPADIVKHYQESHNEDNVTMQHVSRWDRKRKAVEELVSEVGSTHPAASTLTVNTYRRGSMGVLNAIRRSNVFEM